MWEHKLCPHLQLVSIDRPAALFEHAQALFDRVGTTLLTWTRLLLHDRHQIGAWTCWFNCDGAVDSVAADHNIEHVGRAGVRKWNGEPVGESVGVAFIMRDQER
jgi:hypothetical protein